MGIDFRTRSDNDIEEVAFKPFLADTFPELAANAGHYIAPWLAGRQLPDLSLECAGECRFLRQTGTAVASYPGTGDGPRVALTAEEFSGLVNDLYTPMTFFADGSLDLAGGRLEDFLNWWLVLRALLDRRPIHVPGHAMAFPGLDGAPLDLQRGFTLDAPVEEMRHFLETAGYLHLTGVFDDGEMAVIAADIDRYALQYREDDGRSWWATTADGNRRAVRLQAFDEVSDTTAELLHDPRFRRLGDIPGAGHVHQGLEDNAIEALVKPLDVVQGISDLPWHKDCSLGRHSYQCCSLTAGISVTGAGADSGQLRVAAGSHRVLAWPALLADPADWGLQPIDLPTRTGDVTLHLSCTHHMSQAPTARERKVLYTGFRLPARDADNAAASRERLGRARESAYRNVSQ